MNNITWHFGKLPRNTYDTEIFLFSYGELVPVTIPAKTDTNKRKRHKFFNFVAPCKIQDKYFYGTGTIDYINTYKIQDKDFCIMDTIDYINMYKNATTWALNNIKNADAASFITNMLADRINKKGD